MTEDSHSNPDTTAFGGGSDDDNGSDPLTTPYDGQESPTLDGGSDSGSGDEPPQDSTNTGDADEGGQDDEDGGQASDVNADEPKEGDSPQDADNNPELNPSEILPGGSLTANEAAGGHAVERHVDKSVEYLKDRTLGNIPGAPSGRVAGSYPDLVTAELATAVALDKRSAEISSWLQEDMSIQANRRKLFKNVEVSLEDIGYAVKRLGSAANPTGWEHPEPTHVTVMLVHEPDMPPHNFRVHTSYPVPTPEEEIQIPSPTTNP